TFRRSRWPQPRISPTALCASRSSPFGWRSPATLDRRRACSKAPSSATRQGVGRIRGSSARFAGTSTTRQKATKSGISLKERRSTHCPRTGHVLTARAPKSSSWSLAMTENPSAVVEAAFRAVYVERMQDLSFVNPVLSVEAVDVLPWNGHWLGVLITPWFMNLILLPESAEAWPALHLGEKCEQVFPAGIFEFIAG